MAALTTVILILPLGVGADSVVQGFLANSVLTPGQVVSLSKNGTTVQLAPADNPDAVYGVVVDQAEAPLTLNREGQQVFVALGGSYPVTVSSQNGVIRPGDYLSISGIAGVAMKATPNQSMILGHAIEGFDGQSAQKAGAYNISNIKASISVTRNPSFTNSLAIPQPLQRIGNSIAGHEVSPFRVYAALIIFIVASVLTMILLVVGIRSSMTAMGRNPLSRHLILRGMFEVIGAATAIFTASIIGVYLLLKI